MLKLQKKKKKSLLKCTTTYSVEGQNMTIQVRESGDGQRRLHSHYNDITGGGRVVHSWLEAMRSSREVTSSRGLEAAAPAPLWWCSPWLWLLWGPLQLSPKQHSIFAPELLPWAFSQKPLYVHDFITVSGGERRRVIAADARSPVALK